MKNITVTQPKIIKHLQDKDILYHNKERQRLSKPGQPVFLLWDFFRGQMVKSVINILEKHNFFKRIYKIT